MGATPSAALPPGVLVEGSRSALARVFPLLVPLQPIRYAEDGLVCAPRACPEGAGAALEAVPLASRALRQVPSWPRLPARMAGGWYVRSTEHAPAPGPTPTMVLADGEGFGA
ncbi:MAG: hypothetical protein MJA84_06820, partial [Firmicutes bacterium]|nr:hypothetical protein [Bacillota bacterium]